MSPYFYRISGLIVASELELAGAWPLETSHDAPDVVMRAGAVPQVLENPTAARPGWDADDDHFLLRGPGVGRFLITRGQEVVFETEPGVPEQACAAYLQGTVLGVLLHQRGGAVLHASGIEADGGAILFLGASGEGKSTLAAALSKRGYSLICDDVSLISFGRDGRPLASADARRLKLTESAIRATGLEAGQGEAVLANTDKVYVSPPLRWTGAEIPLRAIYVLRSTGVKAPAITRLPTAAALDALRLNAHRPKIVRHTGQLPRYFEATARMLEYAAVFAIDRARDLRQLAPTMEMLEAHWRATPGSNLRGTKQ